MSAWQFPSARAERLHTWAVERAQREDWTTVLASARPTHSDWQAAGAGRREEDALPLPHDGDAWSPWNVANHIAGWLDRAGAALHGARNYQDESARITHHSLGPMSPREYAVFATRHLGDHVKQLRAMRKNSAETAERRRTS